MRRCLACNVVFAASFAACPGCGSTPARVNDFLSFAPQLADEGQGFKASYFADLAKLEEANFWFTSRNQLIIWALRAYYPNLRSFLEIGCGTGYVLAGVANAFPHARLYGSEIFTAGLEFAARRVPAAQFMQLDARSIPYSEEFDVVGALDVLEHIEDDQRVLSQIHAALNPGGFAVLTVPQHKWLWSRADEYACHVRRYSAPELHQKLQAAGFRLVRSTSFISVLLPLMAASRWFRRKDALAEFDATAEYRIARWQNAMLAGMLKLELLVIRCGISLPMGGSRLIIAQKR